MLDRFSHVRQGADRKAVAALDNTTATTQLGKWQAATEHLKLPEFSAGASLQVLRLNMSYLRISQKTFRKWCREGLEPPTSCL